MIVFSANRIQDLLRYFTRRRRIAYREGAHLISRQVFLRAPDCFRLDTRDLKLGGGYEGRKFAFPTRWFTATRTARTFWRVTNKLNPLETFIGTRLWSRRRNIAFNIKKKKKNRKMRIFTMEVHSRAGSIFPSRSARYEFSESRNLHLRRDV